VDEIRVNYSICPEESSNYPVSLIVSTRQSMGDAASWQWAMMKTLNSLSVVAGIMIYFQGGMNV